MNSNRPHHSRKRIDDMNIVLSFLSTFSAWRSKFSSGHDDVIKWKYFPRYWPFVREIHRSPVNFPHKGQWRGALMFTLICARKNGWVNNGEAGDLRRYLAHYGVIVMRHALKYSHTEIPDQAARRARENTCRAAWHRELYQYAKDKYDQNEVFYKWRYLKNRIISTLTISGDANNNTDQKYQHQYLL